MAIDNILRLALRRVGKDTIMISVRSPRKFTNVEYKYLFDVTGGINCFQDVQTIYKNDKKIYQLKWRVN